MPSHPTKMPMPEPVRYRVKMTHTVILFSSRFVSCKEHLPYMKTDNIYFSRKFVLLLHPIGRLSLFMSKFLLLGQRYSLMILSKVASSSLDNIWPEPDSQDLYWTNGKRPFTQAVLWNHNYFLWFRFRFRLLKSYGSGSGSDF
jgi:hypothetical protein